MSHLRTVLLVLSTMFPFEIFAVDIGMVQKSYNGKYDEKYKKMMDEFGNTVNDFNVHEAKRKVVFYAAKTGFSFVPIIGSGVASVFEGFEILSESVSRDKFDKAVNAMLYDFYKKDKARFNNVFAIVDHIKKTEEVYKALNELDSFGEVLNNSHLNADERSIFNSMAIISLSNITKAITPKVLANEEAINNLRNDNQVFKSFIEKNGPLFKKFLSNEYKKEKVTVELSKTGAEVSKSISKVKEKPSIITENNLNTTEEDKKTSEKLKKDITEYVKTAEEYRDYANASFKIAVNLGLKGKDLERASKAMHYINTTVEVASGIVQGMNGSPMGYFQAAVSVSSLFAKKKPSPEQQRFEAIMGAFDQVFENQKIILENQKRIYELQVDTYELVMSLYKLNVAQFKKINSKLTTVLGNQAALQASINEFSVYNQQLDNCPSFFNSRFKCKFRYTEIGGDLKNCYKEVIDNHNPHDAENYRYHFVPNPITPTSTMLTGNFSIYGSVLKHFNKNNNQDNYADCKKGLASIFKVNPHRIFYSSSHVDEDEYKTQTEKVIDPIYKPLFNIIRYYYSGTNEIDLNGLYRALTLPQKTYEHMEYKAIDIKRYLIKEKEDTLSEDSIINALDTLLYPPAIERLTNYLIELSKYHDIVNIGFFTSSINIYSEKQVMKSMGDESSDELNELFYSAVKLVNIAIAQQNLMAGDSVFNLIDRIITKGLSHPLYTDAIKVIKNHELLRKNYFVYKLRKALKYSTLPEYGSVNSYEEILARNINLYSDFISTKINDCLYVENTYKNCSHAFIEKINTGFTFAKGKIQLYDFDKKPLYFDAPSAERLRNGEMEFPYQIYRLSLLRNKLYEAIAGNKGAYNSAVNENLYAH